MTVGAWVTVGIFLVAAAWTLAVVWPFMRDTRRAAVEGLKNSQAMTILLAKLESRAAAVLERAERLLDAAEAAGAAKEKFEAAGAAVESIARDLKAIVDRGAKDMLSKI